MELIVFVSRLSLVLFTRSRLKTGSAIAKCGCTVVPGRYASAQSLFNSLFRNGSPTRLGWLFLWVLRSWCRRDTPSSSISLKRTHLLSLVVTSVSSGREVRRETGLCWWPTKMYSLSLGPQQACTIHWGWLITKEWKPLLSTTLMIPITFCKNTKNSHVARKKKKNRWKFSVILTKE